MMSISPVCGQPTWSMSVPSIQNAGHSPAPTRHLDARLDPAVGDLEPVLGQQPRRGVLARAVVALQRSVGRLGGDHQVALAVGGGVVRAGGVVLQLVVAPAGDAVDGAVADLVAPDARVRRGARLALNSSLQTSFHFDGIAGAGLVVGEPHLDVLAAVLAVVPEAQPGADRSSPGRSGRCGRTRRRPCRSSGRPAGHARRRPGRAAPADCRPRSPGCSASPCCRPTRDTGRSRSRRAAPGRTLSLSRMFTRAIGGRPSAAPPVGLDSSTSTPRSPWYFSSSIVTHRERLLGDVRREDQRAPDRRV